MLILQQDYKLQELLVEQPLMELLILLLRLQHSQQISITMILINYQKEHLINTIQKQEFKQKLTMLMIN